MNEDTLIFGVMDTNIELVFFKTLIYNKSVI